MTSLLRLCRSPHGRIGAADGEAALEVFAVEHVGRSDLELDLVAVVDIGVAGKFAVVEAEDRREGLYLERLLAA